jgi:hypothetical protein
MTELEPRKKKTLKTSTILPILHLEAQWLIYSTEGRPAV